MRLCQVYFKNFHRCNTNKIHHFSPIAAVTKLREVMCVIISINDNTICMNNTKAHKKGFIITLILSLLIAAMAVAAFVPTIVSNRARTEATSSVSDIDAEAMRMLGCCNAYAAANSFSTTMSGAVKASVIGVKYTQKIHGSRSVDAKSQTFTEVAESVSALVKASLKRERRDGEYYVSHGSYKKKSFTYGDEQKVAKSSYVAQYGQPFTGIVKYSLDGTVITAEQINANTFRYVLDPARSTMYSRNEVKTMLGGKSYPEYSHVEFTVTVDGEKPVKVTCSETFKIDKFGGTSCTAEYNEMFYFNS